MMTSGLPPSTEVDHSPLPSTAVIVPTLNAQRTIVPCLAALRAQTHPCSVIVVDNHSSDGTQRLAAPLANRVLVMGPERSAQRNAGAAVVAVDVLGFIDADMLAGPGVVEQAARAIASGAVAVIVPERTIGSGFWAAVRAFERSFYKGSDSVEAARFFRRDVFENVGGFDPNLDAGEDWDLTIRVRSSGWVARITPTIDHDEGCLTYLAECRKKAGYAAGMWSFARKHGWGGVRQTIDRPYLRRPWRLLYPHPVLGLGVVALKAGESVAVAATLAANGVRGAIAVAGGRRTGPTA